MPNNLFNKNGQINKNETLDKIREITNVLTKKENKTFDSMLNESVWRVVFDFAPVAMCIAGTNTFFKEVNKYFCEMMGYTREEMLTTPYTSFVHPDDIEKTYAQAGKLGAKRQTEGFKNRYIKKNGEVITLEWYSIAYDEGAIIAIAIIN